MSTYRDYGTEGERLYRTLYPIDKERYPKGQRPYFTLSRDVRERYEQAAESFVDDKIIEALDCILRLAWKSAGQAAYNTDQLDEAMGVIKQIARDVRRGDLSVDDVLAVESNPVFGGWYFPVEWASSAE